MPLMSGNRTLLEFVSGKGEWDGEFLMAECRRALAPCTSIPSVQYALNPYGGCEHGCVCCCAPKATHADPLSWRVVRVRSGIAQRLSRELPAVAGSAIAVGTATDPYQYAERRFLLTRSCLEAIMPGRNRVVVLTKSDLVVRDIDLLLGLGAKVAMRVPVADERTSKVLEPGAPSPKARLDAASRLCSEGVETVVSVSPVASFTEGRESELAEAIAAAGVRTVLAEGLDMRHLDSVSMDRRGIAPSESAMGVLEKEFGRRGLELRRSFSV